MIKRFMEMLEISSESGNEAEFLRYLKSQIDASLEGTCLFDGYGNLIAKVPAKNSACTEPLLFACHADTVKPGQGIHAVLEDGVVKSGGDTILGADDKAGIAEILEAISIASSYPPLEVVFTRQEETGHLGAKHLDMTLLKSQAGFIIDLDRINAIANGGPSNMFIEVVVSGKSAHAGMHPEKGVSAIRAASAGICSFEEGRIDDNTTVNIGTIKGGEGRNVVPEKVQIIGECRSLNHEECVAQSQRIKQAFEVAAESIGAFARVKLELAYKAVYVPKDSAIVRLARQAVTSVGLNPKVQVISGGTDGSTLNEKGIQCVVIGTGVRDEHTTNEHILVRDMEKAVSILRYILESSAELLAGKPDNCPPQRPFRNSRGRDSE